MIRPRPAPFASFHAAALLACASIGLPVLGQNTGDVMQVYERAERQVEKLNQIVPVAEKAMVATAVAVKDFAAATTPAAVEGATQKALTSFRTNERSLENLSRLLQDLSDSFRGLTDIGDSNAGAEQLESLQQSLVNADTELSKLAEAGVGQQWADLPRQQISLIQSALQAEHQESLLRQAEQHRANAEGPANLQRIGEILSRLSVMVDVVKIKNDVNRTLLLAMALRNAPNAERRESLERIIGNFDTPVEMGKRVDSLLAQMNEATADLISGLFEMGGAGFPDFSQEDIDSFLAWENRPREESCEQCTDGLDNDHNGLTDAEQSASCKLFVQRDPTCTLSNAL